MIAASPKTTAIANSAFIRQPGLAVSAPITPANEVAARNKKTDSESPVGMPPSYQRTSVFAKYTIAINDRPAVRWTQEMCSDPGSCPEGGTFE